VEVTAMSQTVAAPIDEVEAATYRAEFPIFEHTTYLNSCSLGPPSTRVFAALDQYQEDWSRYGAPAWWIEWMAKLDAAKERFARLIGAGVHEVTVSHSISSALSSIASTFDYSTRNVVVCAELDFPTIAYQWLAKTRQGVEVRYARSADRVTFPVDSFADVLDARVALTAVSHVFYNTGAVTPLRQVADLAHEAGARIVVDGYHAVGVLPVDVKALDVDFYVGGTLKWLLGGPGLTFIYVREGIISELHPSITGWFSSADQFAFDPLHLVWPQTADRLELGTPSVSTAYSGIAGMDMILEADPARIYQRLQMLTDRIVRRAQQEGYGVRSPLQPDGRGGIVMLELNQPQETVRELQKRSFTVDYRPGLLRVSPHFYNTAEDVDRFMDALAEVQRNLD
jgi:selenocysteine lyase/cysteine desulfurase